MIKINLNKKQKSGGGGRITLPNIDLSSLFGAFKKGGGGTGGESSGSGEGLKNSPLVKVILSGLTVYVVYSAVEDFRKEALKQVDTQIQAVEKQVSQVQAKLAQVKGFDQVKKQLDDDEATVRTKLEVVTQLLESRDAPVKALLQIAQSIPEDVWLSELSMQGPNAKFQGGTLGYNQVSDFIKSLGETAEFSDIALSGIQDNNNSDPANRFQVFDITAKRRHFF